MELSFAMQKVDLKAKSFDPCQPVQTTPVDLDRYFNSLPDENM